MLDQVDFLIIMRQSIPFLKIRVQEILGLCCLRGGTSAEKIRVQEILELCCFKKLVILRGGPVKRTTL